MPRTSNPISEHATSLSYGEIAISDLNVATRQYVAATNTGRVGNTPPNAGFNWNSDNGLKTLHEWVGGMYFTADASGTSDGSLSTGPHAYTMYPSFKGKYCTQNKLRPIPGEGVSMGDMRQHTPITILARTKCRTHDENDYYDGVEPERVPLENITEMPISLFVGGKDPLATQKDAMILSSVVGNIVDYNYFPKFDHSSFLEPWIWSKVYKAKFLSAVDSH